MGYVDRNLMSGENIIFKAKIHWFIFIPGVILFIIGIISFASFTEGGITVGFFAIPISAVLLFRAYILKISTELVVTSKRIITKFGFIKRTTIEMNLSKVESINVNQNISGRILGYGTLIICGTGGGKTPIPNIDSPLVFRQEAMKAIDTSA